jgi:hypothetical protein
MINHHEHEPIGNYDKILNSLNVWSKSRISLVEGKMRKEAKVIDDEN